MSELLLVNPRKRRRSKRRGPRKMSALQAKYFGKRRKSGRRKTRRSTRATTAAPRRSSRRKTRRVSRAIRRFAGSRSGALSLRPNIFIRDTLMPSAIGGAGALLVDVAWGAIPFIPANLKTGPLAPFVKAAGAVAVGLVASQVAGKKFGGQVVSGYLTVFAYNMLKGLVQQAMPQLPMGEYDMGWVQAGVAPQYDASIGAYLEAPAPSAGMGAYLNEYDSGTYENAYS